MDTRLASTALRLSQLCFFSCSFSISDVVYLAFVRNKNDPLATKRYKCHESQRCKCGLTFYIMSILSVFYIYVGPILRILEELSVAGQPHNAKHCC